MLMKRRGERGQAIFETALFIPLILLSMYGIFVISSEGSMSERVQLGVRNGGSIFAPGNPYLSFSTYNLYSSIDGVDPADPSANCNGALPDTTLLSASRTTFWKPAATAPLPTTSCTYAKGIVQINGAFYPLQSDFLKMSAQTGVSAPLVGKVIPNATLTIRAAQNYLTAGSLGEILQSSSVGAAIKGSLEPQSVTQQTPVINCTSSTNCPGNVGQYTVPTPSPYPSSPPVTVTLPPKGATPAPTSIPSYSVTGV
jgi:hypothetical protein